MTAFSTLELSPAMLKNLEQLGYTEMTEIQKASIPVVLSGRDVMAQAKTGSGKTAAFGIGMMENLNAERFRVQSLVLCPTRELAVQVSDELRRIARFKHNLKLVSLSGGVPIKKQELSLKHQAHVVVGTPGRVLKLLERGALVLDELSMVVFDEADRMLEMGFIEQIRSIWAFVPQKCQSLCFSATFSEPIKALSREILSWPKEIIVDTHHDMAVIAQAFYRIEPKNKVSAVLELLGHHRPESSIIFCNTKDECRRVCTALEKAGVFCLALHGDLEQKERTEVLVRFSNRSISVLVATDVAARGLDIDDLDVVLNFSPPFDAQTYIHRVGRTGRAGAKGRAFTLFHSKEEFRLEEIQDVLNEGVIAEAFPLKLRQSDPDMLPPMITLSINGGRKNKISPGDILGALTKEGGIQGSEVGKIDRMDYLSFVAVKREKADEALSILKNSPIKGRKFLAIMNA